ncbi:hypothetical protein H8F21_15100 [Pseudomonas sp. P66]|uniref:Uncharacterized protein n=1 Tax=Pseudomonas arcuscaelestis TaxID=2710591 RepID=A0ABS2BZ40_9PSED|nr:hypothetical protein [Pseudomonas arcuscaelestis]MBM5458892.1 hypothetical protein [Pseudomonas arcuscaelestis]
MKATLTTEPGAGRESGEVHTVISGVDPGDAFFIVKSGRLVRHPLGNPLTYISNDASGAFRLSREVDGGRHESTVKFHNGIVTAFTDDPSPFYGYRFAPTWVKSHCVDADDVLLSLGVAQLVELIRAVQAGEPVNFTDDTTRAMVGLALCSPDLLGPMNPADTWVLLDDTHMSAIASWAR